MSRKLQALPEGERTPLTDLLYEKIQERDLTLEELGKAVGHSFLTVAKIIKGRMRIPMPKIEAYANALHIRPLVLLEMVYPETLKVVQRCLEDDKTFLEE